MDIWRGLIVGVAVALPTSVATAGFEQVEIEFWTGSGSQEALMVVDWLDGQQLAFGYRWDGDATGLDMMLAVADDDRFFLNWHPGFEFLALDALGYDVDGDGFDQGDPDDYYAFGWDDAYWSYWVGTNGDDWGFAPVGLGDRDLRHGDWDGWAFAPGFDASPPTVPLIPAPASLATLGLVGFIGGRRRR